MSTLRTLKQNTGFQCLLSSLSWLIASFLIWLSAEKKDIQCLVLVFQHEILGDHTWHISIINSTIFFLKALFLKVTGFIVYKQGELCFYFFWPLNICNSLAYFLWTIQKRSNCLGRCLLFKAPQQLLVWMATELVENISAGKGHKGHEKGCKSFLA